MHITFTTPKKKYIFTGSSTAEIKERFMRHFFAMPPQLKSIINSIFNNDGINNHKFNYGGYPYTMSFDRPNDYTTMVYCSFSEYLRYTE